MPVSLASTSASSMHGALVPIAYATFSGSTQSATFTNIPQNYQDLMVVQYGRDSRSVVVDDLLFQVNSDGSSIYSYTYLLGNGSSASSTRGTGANFGFIFQGMAGANATSGIFGSAEFHILNYANTSTYKTILGRGATDANGSGSTTLNVNLYRSTNAVSSLLVTAYSNYSAGSTIALYGIRTVGQ